MQSSFDINTELYKQFFRKHSSPAIVGIQLNKSEKKIYRITEINEACSNLLGIDEKSIVGLYINYSNKKVSPESDKIIKALQALFLANADSVNTGYYCTEDRCFKIVLNVPDEQYFMCTFSDISIEKGQIQESESFFNLIPDLLSVIDENQRFVKINIAWEKVSGYQKYEIIGKNITDLLHPDDLIELEKVLKTVNASGEAQSFINRILCKSGNYRFFEWRIHAFGNKYFTAARDITNRIEKNKRLENINSFTNELLKLYSEKENLDALLNKLMEYTGSSFCALNMYNPITKAYTTVSVTGENRGIKIVENIIGFKLLGRSWQYNPDSDTPLNNKGFHLFSSFLEIPDFFVSKSISRKLHRAFPIGNIASVRIRNQNSLIGDIILITQKGVEFKSFSDYEVYVQQVGLFLKGLSAEQALRRSEAQLRQIIDMVPHFVFAKNIYGRFILANKAIASTFDTTVEEMIGKTDADFIADKKLVSHFRSDDLKVMKSGKELFIKEEQLSIEGKPLRILQTIKIPFTNYDSPDNAVLGVSTDITERVIAEKQVKTSESRYRNLIEMAADTILLGSSDGKIVAANDQAEILTGYRKSEIVTMRIEDLFAPEELVRFPMRYDLLAQGQCVRSERTLKRKDLQLISIEMNTRVMPDNSLHSILRDIQEIKRIQQELIDAKEKAEENDRLKSAFLSNMSHEIRTPMNAIVGFSGLITDKSVSEDKKTYYSEIIEDNCKNLLRIIDDVLDISKIESGQMIIVNTSFNVNRILEKLEEMVLEIISKKNPNLLLFYKKPEKNIEVVADETRLLQVLLNLLNNAINFTPSGSIEFGVEVTNNNLEFFVKDTGIGIAKENLPKIFDRFYRHSAGVSESHRGTGLGLTICKSLIELMGGNIRIESEFGKGTGVFFTIPCIKPIHTVQHEDRFFSSNTDFSSFKALVVEDDLNSLEYLLAVLKKIGFKHLGIARNGNDAVEAALHDNFDIILMDIQLPGINGIDAARKIISAKADSKIIAQTAYAMQNDKDICKAAGCIDYVAKPIKINEIYSILSKHLVKITSK